MPLGMEDVKQLIGEMALNQADLIKQLSETTKKLSEAERSLQEEKAKHGQDRTNSE